MRTDISSL